MNTFNAVQMLDAVTKNTKFDNVADALEYGLPMSLFGFAIVFGVLILIWGILALFKVFFYTIPNAKKNPAPKVKPSPKSPQSAENTRPLSFTSFKSSLRSVAVKFSAELAPFVAYI